MTTRSDVVWLVLAGAGLLDGLAVAVYLVLS